MAERSKGWSVRGLGDLPLAATSAEGPVAWHPIAHHLRLTAFGANLFVARTADAVLIDTHDEAASGQEELYIVLGGSATFVLDGQPVEVRAPAAVAVTDPRVTREARAGEADTALLAIGAGPGGFATTWRPEHFEDVPQV